MPDFVILDKVFELIGMNSDEYKPDVLASINAMYSKVNVECDNRFPVRSIDETTKLDEITQDITMGAIIMSLLTLQCKVEYEDSAPAAKQIYLDTIKENLFFIKSWEENNVLTEDDQ